MAARALERREVYNMKTPQVSQIITKWAELVHKKDDFSYYSWLSNINSNIQ